MTFDATVGQIPLSGRFIVMDPPRAASRAFGRATFNRFSQIYTNAIVRRGVARLDDPLALAREIALWRRIATRNQAASMPHGSIDAIKVVGPHHGLPAPPVPSDWFAPLRGEPRGFIFYVHGGSFIFDRSPALTELVMRFAAAANARVYAPNYRLAPEHPCPAAVEDIVEAFTWFRDTWPDEPVVALAESAGASILLAALQVLRRAGKSMPDGIVLLAPWVDLTLQSWSIVTASLAGRTTSTMPALALMVRLYLGQGSAADAIASPLFGDFTDFPPMLIHATRGDLLFDDAARLAERVRDAGTDLTARLWVEDAHVMEKSASAKARQSIELAGAFIRNRLG